MVLWMGTEAILDPRPGGSYRINVTGRDIAVGRYHEVVPNTRVVFTWGWEGEGSPVPPGSTTLEITLTPQGNGTLVRLRHLGLPEPAQEQHQAGWIHYLERLAAIASGGDPGPDPWAQQQPQTM
ncbi:MAG: SRPBCC domain-containing protein [Chloroflexi bacterium]|nr:SRPBCC domain-containing protein [Chloroflexota bacterium]